MFSTTPRFASTESTVRRIAAGLAMAVTFGIVAGVGALADESYDQVLIAHAEKVPVQVVVITAPRLPAQG